MTTDLRPDPEALRRTVVIAPEAHPNLALEVHRAGGPHHPRTVGVG